jgi:hypothetical protein
VSEQRSPRVVDLSWGEVRVEDHGAFRDAKLWPGGARGWDWNETGTSHTPGVQVADVEELVDEGAEVVVLSRGQNRRLQVQDETLDWLIDQGVSAEVLESNEAVERYNELAEDGQAVGALIHSTC